MPTEYRPPTKPKRPDWVSLLGVLGASTILVATTVSYLRNLETKEEARCELIWQQA
jgi:hypothetical protein